MKESIEDRKYIKVCEDILKKEDLSHNYYCHAKDIVGGEPEEDLKNAIMGIIVTIDDTRAEFPDERFRLTKLYIAAFYKACIDIGRGLNDKGEVFEPIIQDIKDMDVDLAADIKNYFDNYAINN